MEKDFIEYKETAKNLYDGTLPTVHHINMILADRVVKAFEVQGHEKSVTIQIVEGDITQQYTHVLINVSDAH